MPKPGCPILAWIAAGLKLYSIPIRFTPSTSSRESSLLLHNRRVFMRRWLIVAALAAAGLWVPTATSQASWFHRGRGCGGGGGGWSGGPVEAGDGCGYATEARTVMVPEMVTEMRTVTATEYRSEVQSRSVTRY